MSKGPKAIQTTQGTQTNTYGQIVPQNTPEMDALRGWKYTSDPAQPYMYARAHEDLHESFHNPYGAYTTPAIRDAAMRSGDMELRQR